MACRTWFAFPLRSLGFHLQLVNSHLRTIDVWQFKLLLAFMTLASNNNSDDQSQDIEFLRALEIKLRQQLSEGTCVTRWFLGL